jgi:UDPglucose 6-dehydrogenase
MKITVVGTGYVGLVAGVCFADAGHQVICVDKDKAKIDLLVDGKVPIYEPGLEDIMGPAYKAGRLKFTTDLALGVRESEAVFIAVQTPEKEDGSADLSITLAVAAQIAELANDDKILVLKSTVPVGTSVQVQKMVDSKSKFHLEVVNNPEFLKEGAAVDDFLRPDRIVIGCKSDRARKVMSELYAPFVKNGNPILMMDNASAELTKYAANAFLSVKISFINELARLADKVGADIEAVRDGFTSDSRINPAFFYPGLGFGGSCFPKDVKALVHTGKLNGVDMQVVQAADEVNDRQKTIVVEYLKRHFGKLKGMTFALWGLSFKPRTDDVREAPALYVIDELTKAGAKVVAYDPVAGENAKRASRNDFILVGSSMEALQNADALIIATEWNEFRSPDFAAIKKLLKTPVIVDGRNVYEPEKVIAAGFSYYCVGRQSVGRS